MVDRRRSSRTVVGKWELLKNNAQICLSEWDYSGKPVTTSHLFLKKNYFQVRVSVYENGSAVKELSFHWSLVQLGVTGKEVFVTGRSYTVKGVAMLCGPIRVS